MGLCLLSPLSYAEQDALAELNATIKQLDKANTEREIQNTLTQLEALKAQHKPKVTVQEPTLSSIPMPGQAAAPIPRNYPAPVPGTVLKTPNIFNNPAPPTDASKNIYR